MKILTFRRLVGMAALGGFAYVHRQRGGEWNMASIKDTLRHIWSSAGDKANQVREASAPQGQRSTRGSEPTVRTGGSESSRGAYGYGGRDEDIRRH